MTQQATQADRWAPERGTVEPDAATPKASAVGSSRRGRPPAGVVLPIVSLLAFTGLVYGVWEIASLVGAVPDIILPTPLQVWQAFGAELSSGDLQTNIGTTLQEALGGFALAAVAASLAGYAIAHVRGLEMLAAPFIAASQAIPVVAIAPLIILLFGGGLLPHIIVSAVVVVFPLLVTAVTGLRGVERDYYDVARVFGASRLQTLVLVEAPLAAPVLLSGIKLGLTLAVMGAVVSEYVSASSGMGFMVNGAIGNFEVATRYVALITLALLSITLFGLVTIFERIILSWQND